MVVFLTLLGATAILVIAVVASCALHVSATEKRIPAFSYPSEEPSLDPIPDTKKPRSERRQKDCHRFPVMCADGSYVWHDRRKSN